MRKFFARSLAWIRSGWGTTTLLGLEEMARRLPSTLWRRIGDIDTLRDLWEWAGGDMPTLISLVASPFFGLGLVIVGLIGIPAATRSADGHTINRAWTFLGWGVFGSCAAVLVAALLFGRFAESSGVVEARKFYIEQHTERHLTDAEIKSLVDAFSPIKDQMTDLHVASIDTSEATGYAVEFIYAFRKAGCVVNNKKPDEQPQPFPEGGRLTSPKMRGVFIGIKIGEPIPDKAKLFAAKLTEAGFKPQDIGWDGIETEHFVFVIGNR